MTSRPSPTPSTRSWRRASTENLRRNFVGPILVGVVAAALFFALGVRSAVAALSLALSVFVAATLLFGIQNRELVTMSFLRFEMRAPLAILAVVFYLLGAATGGSLFALLRRSIHRSRARRPATP